MSLINDALKRAKQTEGRERPQRSVGVNLEPAESRGGAAAFPVWLVPLLLVALLLIASWFFTQWWRQRSAASSRAAGGTAAALSASPGAAVSPGTPPAEVRPAVVAPPAPAAGVATPANPPAVAAVERSRASSLVRVNTNLVVRTNAVAEAPSAGSPPAVQTERPAAPVAGSGSAPGVAPLAMEGSAPPVGGVKWPDLKVQAIFFRRTNPSALINGESLEEGETILGAKVIRIDRQTVVLEMQGQTNTLQLGRR